MKSKKTDPAADNVVFVDGDGNEAGSKRNKAFPKKLAMIALLAVVIGSMLCVAGASGWLSPERISLKFVDWGKGRRLSENMPLEMNGLRVSELDEIGYCFGILDDLKYSVYSPEGNLLYSFSHNMTSPVTVCSEKRVAMYERGNYRVTVFSRKGEIYTKAMENAVITADINKRNEIAVATTSDRYLGQVTVFDASGNEMLTWYSADHYITDVALSDDGKRLAVALLRVENGEEMSKVCIFTVGETDPAETFDFGGETVFDIRRFGSSDFMTVGTSSVAFIDRDAQMTGEYLYNGQTLSHFTCAGNTVILVFASRNGEEQQAVVINDLGKQTGSFSLDDVDYICGADDGSVYICSGGAAYKYQRGSGEVYEENLVKTDNEIIKVLPKGKKLLILSIDSVDLIEPDADTREATDTSETD